MIIMHVTVCDFGTFGFLLIVGPPPWSKGNTLYGSQDFQFVASYWQLKDLFRIFVHFGTRFPSKNLSKKGEFLERRNLWKARGTSLVFSAIFIRFEKYYLKEMFTKLSSCELRENRCSESHTSLYVERVTQISILTFRIYSVNLGKKIGTGNPHIMLSSNYEFVEKLPVEGLGVSKRAVIITPSALRQTLSLFPSEFSTQCDLVLPLSISSTLSFL
jgi:hypothetical protein